MQFFNKRGWYVCVESYGIEIYRATGILSMELGPAGIPAVLDGEGYTPLEALKHCFRQFNMW